MTLSDLTKSAIKERFKKKKSLRPRKWLDPINIERKYRTQLHKLTRQFFRYVNQQIIPIIKPSLEDVEGEMPKNDSVLDLLNSALKSVAELIKKDVDQEIINANEIGNEIAAFNYKQFQKVFTSALGIDIFIDEPWLVDQLQLFSEQNAQLITSLPEQELLQISGIVQRGMQQGLRFTSVANQIKKRYGITRRRANLIARDQTTKLNSSLTMLRQQELGITKYKWLTAGDERVRATHRANNGKIFSWDTPPPITGHPGNDINCRCNAIAVLEDLIDE